MDQTITGWRRYFSVQPPVMLLLFALAMSGTILTDLIVYRTCTITLGINETECMILHNNSSSPEALKIDLLVQPHATLILMSKSFIENIFPSFLSLFVGPWSDKYGRKPVILSGYIGITLTYILLSIMTSWDIGPWYLLIAYIPYGLLGGICVLILASICYITDITDENGRAWQLAWFEALNSVGLLMGIFSGPAIFEAYGYTTVFIVATLFCFVATLYVLFYVPETIQSNTREAMWKIFDVMFIKDLVSACVTKRHGFNRSVVWSCISCLTLSLFVMQGEMSIGYLFTSARLGWTVQSFSNYVGTGIILGIVGTIFCFKLLRKYIDISDVIVAIISVISSLISALVCALAWQSWHMYLAASIGMFGDISRPVIRAILSRFVPSKETGKIFSLTLSLETLLPFGAASLYTLIYSHYMPPLYPLPVWFISVALYTVIVLLLINIQIQIEKHNLSCDSLIQNADPDH